MTYAEVRELIERTALTYEQIKAKTGVDTGTISCWARDGGFVVEDLGAHELKGIAEKMRLYRVTGTGVSRRRGAQWATRCRCCKTLSAIDRWRLMHLLQPFRNLPD